MYSSSHYNYTYSILGVSLLVVKNINMFVRFAMIVVS